MDFEILPQLIIILSMAGILTIVGKNFSKMKQAGNEEIFREESEKERQEKEKFLYLYRRATRRINQENYQKKMAAFWVWLEKLLRKLRIFFLKLDGRMVSVLERLRQKNIESLEELKRRTEMNKRRERAGEALSKFWTSTGWKGKAKSTAEIAASIQAGAAAAEKGAELLAEAASAAVASKLADEKPASTEPEEEEPGEEEREEKTEQTGDEKTGETGTEAEARTETIDAATVPAETEESLAMREMAEETPTIAEEMGETSEPAIIQAQEEEMTGEENYTEAMAENIREAKGEEETETPASAEEEPLVETEEEKRIRTRKEQEYIDILMQNPVDIKAYWKLGLLYSRRRNYEDALACFRQIVKIDPTYTKAKQKAIELMEKMKGKVK